MGEAGLRYLLLSGRCLIHYYNKLIWCFSNLLPTVGGSEQNKSLQAGKSPYLTVLPGQRPSLCTFRSAGTLQRDDRDILAIYCT